MDLRTIPLISLLLFSTAALADPTAKIDGPTESQAGNMVVLNSVATVGSAKQWIIPDELAGRYFQTGDVVAFAVRDEGQFRFSLVAVEVDEAGEVLIDIASHTVTITDGFGTTPAPDPEPDKPPVSDFDALKRASKAGAIAVGDSVTAKQLADAIAAIASRETVPETQRAFSAAVEGVLLNRKGASRDADWLGKWRRPVESEFVSVSPSSPSEYLAAIRVVGDGVRDSLDSASARSVPVGASVVMEYGDNCPPCEAWKARDSPALKAAGCVVEHRRAKSLPVPKIHAYIGDTHVHSWDFAVRAQVILYTLNAWKG